MLKPGRPSDFGFKSISEMPPGTRVILVCRESKNEQRKKLRYQRLFNTKAIEKAGGIVIDLGAENLSIVANGRDCYFWMRAEYLGRKHNAAVVVESISRLNRNQWFRIQADKFENKKLQPNVRELEEVQRAFKRAWVTVYTVLHPDSTADEEREYERNRTMEGMKLDGKEPPRPGPKKKEKRANNGKTSPSKAKKIVDMFSQGIVVKGIAAILKMPDQTVRDVLKRNL